MDEEHIASHTHDALSGRFLPIVDGASVAASLEPAPKLAADAHPTARISTRRPGISTARHTVEEFLLLHSRRDFRAALSLLSDDCIAALYGPFRDHCSGETALRYGYPTCEAAHAADLRDFVTRMLESSARDAGGANPSAAAIPDVSDCHVRCKGDDEVIVTLATPQAVTTTMYHTEPGPSGRRLIRNVASKHASRVDSAE